MPARGEQLRIGDVSQITSNERIQKALRRLAADKAPQTVSQLVLWKLSSDADWDAISGASRGWANAYEVTMAERFVEQMDSLPDDESASLFFEFSDSRAPELAGADALKAFFKDKRILGLKATMGIPVTPRDPAVACTVQLGESEAWVQTIATNATATAWVPIGKFSLPIVKEEGKFQVDRFADDLAEGVLNRLVRAQLTKGPKSSGKNAYRLRIDNASPLILNGLGILGSTAKADEPAKILPPLSLAPRRSVTMPASEAVVRHLELKKGSGGVRVVAADLSGL
jgi:hypothetical protein